jgi:hypothetical protein
LKSEGLGKQPSHDVSSFSPDQFNVHFSSVAAGVRSQVVFDRKEIFEAFAFRCVEEDEGARGSVEANEFSLKFIKKVLSHILSVLTHLFNFSITTCTFPFAWKTALVLPLPKCGSPTGLSDFRPKSILSVLSKEFERLICDQFLVYLDSGGLLSPYQSGFCKFRSTANALIKIMDHIQLEMERSGFSISVLLNFSNAFDFMSHNLLLHKVRFKFELSSTACWLFGSFRGPRTQKVMINEDCSDSVDINIGSPQGSVLSPILFASFINDLDDHSFHLYADDLQIYTVNGCEDVNRLVALVNGDLQRILDWSRDNSLVLNASKTQALLVS